MNDQTMCTSKVSTHAWMLLCILLVEIASAQQNFQIPRIPSPFRVGNRYPPRPETDVCRPIEDHIDRGSARFQSQLVLNNNPDITFSTTDSRYMSSRLQSNLNNLATRYRGRYGSSARMTVLKSWTPYPDSDPSVAGDGSLHYEGEAVFLPLLFFFFFFG